MAKLNMVEAINLALREEMERDSRVVVLGEDVGKEGGVFRVTYPVSGNLTTTSVVVQYRDGGIVDAHQIYRQLDEVKFQYGCFHASYLRDGVPTVPAPAALSAPCP